MCASFAEKKNVHFFLRFDRILLIFGHKFAIQSMPIFVAFSEG